MRPPVPFCADRSITLFRWLGRLLAVASVAAFLSWMAAGGATGSLRARLAACAPAAEAAALAALPLGCCGAAAAAAAVAVAAAAALLQCCWWRRLQLLPLQLLRRLLLQLLVAAAAAVAAAAGWLVTVRRTARTMWRLVDRAARWRAGGRLADCVSRTADACLGWRRCKCWRAARRDTRAARSSEAMWRRRPRWPVALLDVEGACC